MNVKERLKRKLAGRSTGPTKDPKTLCVKCGKSTQCFHEVLKQRVCQRCQKAHPEHYETITAADAQRNFGATDQDLARLPQSIKTNSNKPEAPPVRIYLKTEVENLMIAKYGSR
jgi:hypothetical protein